MIRRSDYIRRETTVSAAINAAISVAFFLLAFGVSGPVQVWGIGNLVFDALPQSFAIGLMASVVPGFLARKALSSGRIANVGPGSLRTQTILLLALRNALLAVVAGGALWAIAAYLAGVEVVSHTAALLTKCAYGAALGALTTRLFLLRLTRSAVVLTGA